jgi:hypothetical protein
MQACVSGIEQWVGDLGVDLDARITLHYDAVPADRIVRWEAPLRRRCRCQSSDVPS